MESLCSGITKRIKSKEKWLCVVPKEKLHQKKKNRHFIIYLKYNTYNCLVLVDTLHTHTSNCPTYFYWNQEKVKQKQFSICFRIHPNYHLLRYNDYSVMISMSQSWRVNYCSKPAESILWPTFLYIVDSRD